jgi:anti-anti-sigma factor
MSSELKIVSRKVDGVAVIELHGDLDSSGDAAVKQAYHEAIDGGASTVLFNMSGTQYINTSGISVLITVVMEAKKAGHKILVSGVSPHYKKVFDLVRFSTYVTMFDTEEAALASTTQTTTQADQPSTPAASS